MENMAAGASVVHFFLSFLLLSLEMEEEEEEERRKTAVVHVWFTA